MVVWSGNDIDNEISVVVMDAISEIFHLDYDKKSAEEKRV